MEDYIKCELIDGVSPRHLNFFSNLFNVDYTMHTKLSTKKYQNIPYLVAIVDCTHVGSATAYFED